jgi:membrane protein
MPASKKESITRRFKDGIRRIRCRLFRIRFVRFSFHVLKNLAYDHASDMVGAIAYYVLLAIFPLILGIISLFGFFLPQAQLQMEMLAFIHNRIPVVEGLVVENIADIIRTRETIGVFSIAGLLWSGGNMFEAIRRGVNRAWGVRGPRSALVQKIRNLALSLGVGLLLPLALGINTLASHLNPVSTLMEGAAAAFINLLLMFGVFLLIYKYTPNTGTRWRYVWAGALTAALLFEAARNLSSVYFTRYANYEEIYGSIASTVVFLVWIYYTAYILIIGAEVASQYSRGKSRLKPRHLEASE